MNHTAQGNKYTVNYTDKDIAKSLLNELLVMCMKTKHKDETEEIKKLIMEHIQHKKD